MRGLLSARQAELLSLRCDGLTNNQIAERCEVSIDTVKTHMRRAFEALGAVTIAQAVMLAILAGELPVPLDRRPYGTVPAFSHDEMLSSLATLRQARHDRDELLAEKARRRRLQTGLSPAQQRGIDNARSTFASCDFDDLAWLKALLHDDDLFERMVTGIEIATRRQRARFGEF